VLCGRRQGISWGSRGGEAANGRVENWYSRFRGVSTGDLSQRWKWMSEEEAHYVVQKGGDGEETVGRDSVSRGRDNQAER
jgi:hypothetical protein